MVANRFLTKSMTVVVPSSDQKMFSRTCGCSSSKDCSGLLKKISQHCFCSTLIVALRQKPHAFWVFLNENHKLRMNHSKIKCDIWERLGSRSLGVILSLLRWTMLLREGLVCQMCTCWWLLSPRWPVWCDPECVAVNETQPLNHVGDWVTSSTMMLRCSPEQPSLLLVNNGTDVH